MAHTIEVPREQWPEFFRALNERAGDRPVRLEVERRELGDQQMGRLLPFREISLESKGSERGDLLITVAGEDGDLTHHIDQPVRVYAIRNEAAEVVVVSIEEADQGRTLVHFERLPEITAETHPTS